MHDAILARCSMLAARFPQMGVTSDLVALTLAELWGVMRYLQRLADV